MMARTTRMLLSALALLGCAPDFDPPSKIQSLRVLAVRKDRPYARPGDTVELGMLLARDPEAVPRPVQILWLAGCENPPGDLYARCFEKLDPASVQSGQGLQFSFSISPDIISRRPRPADRNQPPYGLAYVFFVACAGEVRALDPGETVAFPFGCFSPSGKRLGADDFVAGYTSVFVYDRFTNQNPKITGFTIDGQPVRAECIDEACLPLLAEELRRLPDGGLLEAGRAPAFDAGLVEAGGVLDAGAFEAGPFDVGLVEAGAFDAGRSDSGIREAGTGDASAGMEPKEAPNPCVTGGPACLRACLEADKCDKHDIEVVVDRDSIEHDTVAEARSGDTLLEQMWVNYFADRGSLAPDVALVNDAKAGYNDEHETKLTVPDAPGPFRFWAVVRDSRGGASWARLRLQAR